MKQSCFIVIAVEGIPSPFLLRNGWRRATVESLMSSSVCVSKDGRTVEEKWVSGREGGCRAYRVLDFLNSLTEGQRPGIHRDLGIKRSRQRSASGSPETFGCGLTADA